MQRDNLLRALRDLAELYQAGGLTREEFQSTKQLLLAQMRRASEAKNQPPRAPSALESATPEELEAMFEQTSPSYTRKKSGSPTPTSGAPASPSPGTRPPSPSPSTRPPSPSPASRQPSPTARPTPTSSNRAHPTPPQESVGMEALTSLLQDLHQMHQQGNLDVGTLQAGQDYLLRHFQADGTVPVPSAQRATSPPPSQYPPQYSPAPPQYSPAPPQMNPANATPITPMLAPGQRLLGRYTLEKLLGQGGMGQVFLCYDSVREDRYALKVIHPHLAQFEDLRQRFLQELKVTERLTHPGIVRTYTLEQDPHSGFLFFTMEYVKGVTLDSLLRQAEEAERVPPMPLQVLMSILGELIQILEYAHQQGVIHRDLKPSNIMVGDGYHVKLMDFGIAKVLEGTAVSKHTGFGGFVYYMAPEQLRGGGIVSPASDVFSLGVITYQLLTGEIPMGTIEPPSALWPQLPKDVDKVVLKAMSPRAHQRFSHPRHYWDALLRALHPKLTNIPFPNPSNRPTRPVSLDEVLEKIQQSHPQDAIELSANAELPSQLAQQLLQDLSQIDVPISATSPKRKLPDTLDFSTYHPEPTSGTPQDDIYPDLDDAPDLLSVEPPTEHLSASLELSLNEGKSIPFSIPQSTPTGPHSALSLPEPPEGIEEKILYSQDKTPLLRMVQIPAGTFLMGSTPNSPLAYDNEFPQREVYLDAYWISRTPITHQVWWKFMQESGYKKDSKDFLRHWDNGRPANALSEHPVVDISIEDLAYFCEFYGVSLPTEAQWEKAARGTDGRIWPWGNQPPTPALCNFRDSNIGHTTAVSQYLKGVSPYGLYDCSGNVWEWCSDHWNLQWLEQMGENPKNPHFTQSLAPDAPQSPIHYSIRGGCYRYHTRGVRCAFRYSASTAAPYIGARIVS